MKDIGCQFFVGIQNIDKLKKCVFFVDEFVVMFQRNVFLILEEEMNVSLICLLMKFIYDICFKICVKEFKKLC